MITASQLRSFSGSSWTGVADWSRGLAAASKQTAADLKAQAASVRTSWPDVIGNLVAKALDDRAAAHEELAVAYTDAGVVIDTSVTNIQNLQNDLKTAEAWVVSLKYVSEDDDGTCHSTYQVNYAAAALSPVAAAYELAQWYYYRSLATQATVKIREILIRATDQDRQATIALLRIVGITLPPTNDGPIDMSDSGISFQADANQQDQYGDCTTLSTLIGIAHSNPQYIRDHMKWDAAKGKYIVTLYENGKPVEVEVDPAKLHTDGSQTAATNKPTWLSVYEAAIQQKYGDIKNGQWENVPIERITGQKVPLGPPPDVQTIKDTLGTKPPGVVTVDTTNGSSQPDNVDPAKRVCPAHTYNVKGVDADGNIVLQNPWGPSGGYHNGKYYPGEVHLTPEEYKKWFGNGGVLKAPY